MNRLTERDEFGNADIVELSDMMPEIYAGLSFSETNKLTDALNRLAAYEDTGLTPEECKKFLRNISELEKKLDKYTHAEADGRLIVLPCEPGDVLDLRNRDDIEADFGTVYHIELWSSGAFEVWFRVDTDTVYHVGAGEIGKTVLLASEEARAALGRADNAD